MWRDLEQAFKLLEQEDALRCIVVRGAGGNFAAGADLSEFPALRATADQAEAYGKQMIAALTAIRDCRHPTIAAIEGLCVGGGLEIALMCDLRLGAADSRFGIPIQKVGVAMPYPELAILTQMLGRPTMLALLLEGQLHDAAWAERHGVAHADRDRSRGGLERGHRPNPGRFTGLSPPPQALHAAGFRRAAGARCRRRSALLRGRGNGGLPGGNSRFPRPSNSEVSRQLSAKYLESLSFDSSGLDEAATRG